MLICPYCKERAKRYTYLWANQHGFKKRWFFTCGRWVDEKFLYVTGYRWEVLVGHQCKLIQPELPLLSDKLSQPDLPF